MNTTHQSTHHLSVNETTFRALVGAGALATVLTGALGSPLTLFVLSLIGVYLVMTTIVASDPLYAVGNALWGLFAKRHEPAATY